MVREQIQVPFESGSGTEREESGSTATSLDRPSLPLGMNRAVRQPVVRVRRKIVGYRCSCGATTKERSGVCHPSPIYEKKE